MRYSVGAGEKWFDRLFSQAENYVIQPKVKLKGLLIGKSR